MTYATPRDGHRLEIQNLLRRAVKGFIMADGQLIDFIETHHSMLKRISPKYASYTGPMPTVLQETGTIRLDIINRGVGPTAHLLLATVPTRAQLFTIGDLPVTQPIHFEVAHPAYRGGAGFVENGGQLRIEQVDELEDAVRSILVRMGIVT